MTETLQQNNTSKTEKGDYVYLYDIHYLTPVVPFIQSGHTSDVLIWTRWGQSWSFSTIPLFLYM